MNPAIKKLWIDALRDGRYVQGFFALRHGDLYCCMGVLTDLYLKKSGLEWEDKGNGKYVFEKTGGFLPPSVQKWAKLRDQNPELQGKKLSLWNDDVELSFKEIAKKIDKSF